jgi:uncharacterized membrane protein YgcG
MFKWLRTFLDKHFLHEKDSPYLCDHFNPLHPTKERVLIEDEGPHYYKVISHPIPTGATGPANHPSRKGENWRDEQGSYWAPPAPTKTRDDDDIVTPIITAAVIGSMFNSSSQYSGSEDPAPKFEGGGGEAGGAGASGEWSAPASADTTQDYSSSSDSSSSCDNSSSYDSSSSCGSSE